VLVDVSELIEDPSFASPYTVLRRTGKWVSGRFVVSEPERLAYYGAVQPATLRELSQLGIGDEEKGVMKFFCRTPKDIYITRRFDESDETKAQVSDEIEFRNSAYKVLSVSPWQHHGWTRAFASLKGGVTTGS
jgi:hypothetical protein